MLVQFSLSNYRSYSESQSFSMVGMGERIHPEHLVKASNSRDVSLQKIAAIYGANASGKSNFVKALRYIKNLVTEGRRPKEPMNRHVYRLEAHWQNQPSTFEIDIKVDDTLYNYGFKIFDQYISEEWLKQRTAYTEKLLFERVTTEENETEINFGPFSKSLSKDDKANLQFVARGTRPNQLFLTEAEERNLSYFEVVNRWFRTSLKIVTPEAMFAPLIPMLGDTAYTSYLDELLQTADTGISGIELREVNPSDMKFPKELLMELDQLELNQSINICSPNGERLLAVKEKTGIECFKLFTVHNNHIFNVSDESDGTKRLIDLSVAFFELCYHPQQVYIIDELARSMHTHLMEFLINQFIEHSQKSQLIFTTHQSLLLSLKRFRRGEIWFTEKNPDGATELYSLLEFKSNARYDKDIRKAYLQGRYGAIPKLPQPFGE